jgi:hypothetical protein
MCATTSSSERSQSSNMLIHWRVASSYENASLGVTSSTRSGMTTSLVWLARTSSFLISSELLEFAENTNNIIRDSRIARTIASWKFSPGRTLRLEIQHCRPRFSSALQILAATFWSLDEWLMKISAAIQCSLAQHRVHRVHDAC